jgi:hypothetical protein
MGDAGGHGLLPSRMEQDGKKLDSDRSNLAIHRGADRAPYEMESLGVRALRADVAWQDRVFEGGVAVINEVFTPFFGPSLGHLPWILSAAIFVLALWRRGKVVDRPRLRALLTGLAVLAYGSIVINIGIHWGRTMAEFIGPTALREHYVFAPDSVPRLPAGLVRDNEKHALRLVLSTPDFLVVMSNDRKTVYKGRHARRRSPRSHARALKHFSKRISHDFLSRNTPREALSPRSLQR